MSESDFTWPEYFDGGKGAAHFNVTAPEHVNDHPPRPEYNGELRYVNNNPSTLRRMMEIETDKIELEAMREAQRYQAEKGVFGAPPGVAEVGEPYRGDPRVPVRAGSIMEVAQSGEKERGGFYEVRGCLSVPRKCTHHRRPS